MGELAIQPNFHVTLDYELRDESGELLDMSEGDEPHPIRYVHGYGMIVPGLEMALSGLRVGDEREIVVSAEHAYGEHDDGLVMELERERFPDAHVEVGDEIVLESSDGEEIVLNVVELRPDCIVADANHPLAGKTLRYTVKIREVRPATDEEIDRAAADLDEAHEHVHGPDCDHEDEPLRVIGPGAN
ncbi:MAG TPA: peptidylprolyl isomerase [Polyangiaceae bacterium]|nr:peptidylprolyl isomerase [Polyangiaceae bacterium]